MKKFLLLLVAVAAFGATAVQAQKIGRINTQDLIVLMPERDSAEAKLRAYQEDLTNQMEVMSVEFNTKLNDYQKNATTMTDAIRQQKERELQDIQNRYAEFQENAQQEYQDVSYSLMAPIFQKAQEAIQKVARENGMLLVLDLSQGGVLYFDETNTVDVLPLVKRELGIN